MSRLHGVSTGRGYQHYSFQPRTIVLTCTLQFLMTGVVVDLAEPYRAVVPSLDGPVLRVLAATSRPLTGSEVHRLARVGSGTGVRKVLARLVDQGLVNVTEAGPALLYTANRYHLAWPAVQALMSIRERLIEHLTRVIAGWQVQPVLAGLFGSAARGEGTTGSDLDLLIVRPDGIGDPLQERPGSDAQQWADQVDRLRQDAQDATGNHVQVFEQPASAFQETLTSGERIVEEWRRDLVLLAGRSPWRLPRDDAS
jgi:nucleotidyltransferase-like protein